MTVGVFVVLAVWVWDPVWDLDPEPVWVIVAVIVFEGVWVPVPVGVVV